MSIQMTYVMSSMAQSVNFIFEAEILEVFETFTKRKKQLPKNTRCGSLKLNSSKTWKFLCFFSYSIRGQVHWTSFLHFEFQRLHWIFLNKNDFLEKWYAGCWMSWFSCSIIYILELWSQRWTKNCWRHCQFANVLADIFIILFVSSTFKVLDEMR